MVGYLATFGSLPVEEVPWKSLTHVCHAFLRVDADGKLVKTEAMPNAALTAEGRKNGVPVLLTLGGGNTVRGLEKVITSQAGIDALAKQVVQVVADGAYDGIDLCWQYPRNKATGEGHAKLLSALRDQLNAEAKLAKRTKPYLLTTVVTASPFVGQWVDVKSVGSVVDWISVAAYDMSGPWSQYAGHHAPLFGSSNDPEKDSRSVASAMRYWESRGAAKEKLVMGAPMFGRLMPVGEPHAELDPEATSGHRAMNFSAVRKLAGKSWLASWDEECRAPWLSKPQPKKKEKPSSPLTTVAPDTEQDRQIISYDDRNSIDAKATWARGQGYRGMYFWFLHQDRMPDGRNWLVDSATRAWPESE